MSEREYEVTELMRTANVFYVKAGSRAEAIEKVLCDAHEFVYQADLLPVRPLGIRDARLIRKRPQEAPDDPR